MRLLVENFWFVLAAWCAVLGLCAWIFGSSYLIPVNVTCVVICLAMGLLFWPWLLSGVRERASIRYESFSAWGNRICADSGGVKQLVQNDWTGAWYAVCDDGKAFDEVHHPQRVFSGDRKS